MEAAAIEKLDDLIIESQSQTEESAKLFPLDQTEIVRELEYVKRDDSKIILYHKLKWPTDDKLFERQRLTPYKSEVITSGKIRLQSDDGVAANAWLWDRFAIEVMGYKWNGGDPKQWISVTEELKTEIPSEHKSEAVIGLYASRFEIEREDSEGYVLGAVTYKVKQTYGPYVIWHVFNKPSERDRRDLSRKSRETHNQPGATRPKSEIFTNLKPFADLYDKIFARLEGVTGADANIGQRKDLVNAIWKQGAIDALMDSFEAPRRDLSTD